MPIFENCNLFVQLSVCGANSGFVQAQCSVGHDGETPAGSLEPGEKSVYLTTEARRVQIKQTAGPQQNTPYSA